MKIKIKPVFLAMIISGALITSFGVPTKSYAQSCGGPACTGTQICCRRDTQQGSFDDPVTTEGTDADYQFLLCVSDIDRCRDMGGYNAYPNATPAEEGSEAGSRRCRGVSDCLDTNTICLIRPGDTTGTCRALPQVPGEEASQGTGGSERGLINVLRVGSVDQLVVVILGALVNLGMILLVLALVYVGFLFIWAQGKQEEIKKARDALFWTVIGGLLLLGASGLSLVLQEAIGVL